MSFLLLLWWMSDFCLEKRTETYGGFSMKLVLFSFPLWPRDKTAAMLCSPLLFQRILRESDVPFLMDYCINWIFSVHFVLCNHFKIFFFALEKKNSLIWEALGSCIDLTALKTWLHVPHCVECSLTVCHDAKHFHIFFTFLKCWAAVLGHYLKLSCCFLT